METHETTMAKPGGLGCLQAMIVIGLGLVLFYTIRGTQPPSEEPSHAASTYPKIDTNREVLQYDFKEGRWIYWDELPPDRGDYKLPEPMPDVYVDNIENWNKPRSNRKSTQSSSQVFYIKPRKNTETIIVIGNKRYRINNKPNGDLQWIQIR